MLKRCKLVGKLLVFINQMPAMLYKCFLILYEENSALVCLQVERTNISIKKKKKYLSPFLPTIVRGVFHTISVYSSYANPKATLFRIQHTTVRNKGSTVVSGQKLYLYISYSSPSPCIHRTVYICSHFSSIDVLSLLMEYRLLRLSPGQRGK